jgi:pilus assembly protein CpaF
LDELRVRIKEEVVRSLDFSREISDEELFELIDTEIGSFLRDKALPVSVKKTLRMNVYHSIRKLDVLQSLVDDPSITEIMVNGTDNIFIEKDGKIRKSGLHFESRQRLEDVVQQIVASCNRVVNESSPIVDARLENGSRVNVVLSPIALNGPIVTIRRFPDQPITMKRLIELGSISEYLKSYIEVLVKAGYNIFISGGTGSGKTTFLNALSDFIPKDQRLITIEDNAELQIRGVPNLVRMEARNANVEGCKPITIRDLIKSSLRMRPDWLIVGEVRGGECVDMLQAMNTGHMAMSTGHSNSAQDMLSRLETMSLMGMAELPLPAVRGQIAAGIDIIVHLGRLRDRTRKVLEICEIEGGLDETTGRIRTNTLFRFEETAIDEAGRIIGEWKKEGDLKARENWRQQALAFRFSSRAIPGIIQGAGIAVLFGRLFYDSWMAVVLASPVMIAWVILQRKRRTDRDRRVVGIQFKDAMLSVLTDMKAGYSVENAFVDARKDMELLYGKKSLICMHLEKISKGIKNNIPIETLVHTFGKESDNADIQDFSQVFTVAKRSGGNMTAVMERTIGVISKKIEVEKEIEVLISAKRMEARIMNCVPFFIILYVNFTSGDFFAPLYHNVFGIVTMSVCLAIYIAAYLMSEKIVNIKV